MKMLVLSRMLPAASPEAINSKLADEARGGWELYKAGFIREWYFRTDQPGVVLMIEAADMEEARATLATSPLAQAGLIEFDVIPLGAYLPLEMLFAR